MLQHSTKRLILWNTSIFLKISLIDKIAILIGIENILWHDFDLWDLGDGKNIGSKIMWRSK